MALRFSLFIWLFFYSLAWCAPGVRVERSDFGEAVAEIDWPATTPLRPLRLVITPRMLEFLEQQKFDLERFVQTLSVPFFSFAHKNHPLTSSEEGGQIILEPELGQSAQLIVYPGKSLWNFSSVNLRPFSTFSELENSLELVKKDISTYLSFGRTQNDFDLSKDSYPLALTHLLQLSPQPLRLDDFDTLDQLKNSIFRSINEKYRFRPNSITQGPFSRVVDGIQRPNLVRIDPRSGTLRFSNASEFVMEKTFKERTFPYVLRCTRIAATRFFYPDATLGEDRMPEDVQVGLHVSRFNAPRGEGSLSMHPWGRAMDLGAVHISSATLDSKFSQKIQKSAGIGGGRRPPSSGGSRPWIFSYTYAWKQEEGRLKSRLKTLLNDPDSPDKPFPPSLDSQANREEWHAFWGSLGTCMAMAGFGYNIAVPDFYFTRHLKEASEIKTTLETLDPVHTNHFHLDDSGRP